MRRDLPINMNDSPVGAALFLCLQVPGALNELASAGMATDVADLHLRAEVRVDAVVL